MIQDLALKCGECGEPVSPDEVIWMDAEGSFNDEDGDGNPYCLTCMPGVEDRAIRQADRARRLQEHIDAIRWARRGGVVGAWANAVSAPSYGFGRRLATPNPSTSPGPSVAAPILEDAHAPSHVPHDPPSGIGGAQVSPGVEVSVDTTFATDSGGELTIERLVEAEERCGVVIRGLNARVDREGDVRLLGEVAPRVGLVFPHDFSITVMAYDREGRVVHVRSQSVVARDAFALEPLAMWLPTKGAPARIRVFPRRG